MTGRVVLAALAPAAFLAGCGGAEEPGAPAREPSASPGTPPAVPTSPETSSPPAEWDLASSGEGATLIFQAKGSEPAIRLFCPRGGESVLVNVPAFRPIGSEERMSFGSGGAAHALVADSRGDRRRGGVSAAGPVPDNLGALIGGPVSVSYGAQVSGPHPAPPRALSRAFLEACRGGSPMSNVSACLVQDGERLSNPPLRAVGTEPFWGARIEGRCVTYSHPDDQRGTRVWTRYAPRSGGGGSWTGALEGRPFVLSTRPQPGCSDGMSDRRYPIAIELVVAAIRGADARRGRASLADLLRCLRVVRANRIAALGGQAGERSLLPRLGWGAGTSFSISRRNLVITDFSLAQGFDSHRVPRSGRCLMAAGSLVFERVAHGHSGTIGGKSIRLEWPEP